MCNQYVLQDPTINVIIRKRTIVPADTFDNCAVVLSASGRWQYHIQPQLTTRGESKYSVALHQAQLKMLRYLILALGFVACVVSEGEGEERARLLAAKRVHNLYLVEGRDIVVQYSVHNVGQAAAINVQLTDAGFSTEDFDVAGGQLQVKFDRIAPNANVSHTVVVKPKKYGYFNFTAAEVSYQPSEDSAEIQIGYTSEPGEGGIIAFRDYDRKFSPHFFDWMIFALLMIPALLVPFMMWYNIKSKYATIPRTKKGKAD